MNIADSTVADFRKDGVVVLRDIFRDWVEPLSQGVAEVMAHPSPLERSYQPKDGSAPFFQDLCNWQRIPAFRAFIYESPAAEIAARLMGSATSRFFHDHILVKRPGNSTVTPWHQDQPYYCVEGDRTVSFWTPLDTISRSVSLECVAGSHHWRAMGQGGGRQQVQAGFCGDRARHRSQCAGRRQIDSVQQIVVGCLTGAMP